GGGPSPPCCSARTDSSACRVSATTLARSAASSPVAATLGSASESGAGPCSITASATAYCARLSSATASAANSGSGSPCSVREQLRANEALACARRSALGDAEHRQYEHAADRGRVAADPDQAAEQGGDEQRRNGHPGRLARHGSSAGGDRSEERESSHHPGPR